MQKTKKDKKRKFVEPTLKKEASLVDGTLGLTSGDQPSCLTDVNYCDDGRGL